MRFLVLTLLALPSLAQADPLDSKESVGTRTVTLTGGVGTSLGWLGVQGEKYFHSERFSAFAGIGSGLQKQPASGVALAGGIRAYRGSQNRTFLELSVSKVANVPLPEGSPREPESQVYGPGVQLGYQRLSRSGLTVVLSLGLGYAVTDKMIDGKVNALAGVAVGFTWRRSAVSPP